VKIATHAEYRAAKNKITRDYPNARQRSIRPGWLKRIKMREACP